MHSIPAGAGRLAGTNQCDARIYEYNSYLLTIVCCIATGLKPSYGGGNLTM